MTTDTLDVLLIEDNPGDARLVEEMLRDRQDSLHRIDIDGLAPDRISIGRESDLASGLAYLNETEVDVLLLDLALPDSDGLETLSTALRETEFTPVIVLTGLDDRDRGIQAIQEGAQDYLVKDDVTGELLIHSIQYAIEQTQQERERVRYREQLEALNELNTITQEITHDVITTSSRADLERAVCERLVASDGYPFAWIGEVDRRTGELTPRVTAGKGDVDDYVICLDEDEHRPEAKAASSRQVCVAHMSDTELPFEFAPPVDSDEIKSISAIPIAYRSLFYGLLVIYADSPTAFSGHESEILTRLGDVIGHAITSVERKNALDSDTALQLEFRLQGVADQLCSLSAARNESVEFRNFIRRDCGLLVYGETTLSDEQFRDGCNQSEVIENLRLLSPSEESCEFEFLTSAANPLDSALLSHGGRIASGSIEDGEFRFVVEVPPGREKRQLVDLVETNCEGATLCAHRTIKREDPSVPDTLSIFQNRLTEKQQAALEAAFHAGYFEWPRTTSGGELAERLGITQATFSQHFRAAEREFFTAIFEDKEVAQIISPWEPSESSSETD